MSAARPGSRHLDVPFEHPTASRPHLYPQLVIVKLLQYFRDLRHPLEVPGRVDVEDKDAAVVEVLVRAVEESLPGGEAEQVVDPVVDADDGVERGVQPEAAHIGQVQRGTLGQLRARYRQHAGGYIEAAHLVPARERGDDPPGSAGHFKQRHSLSVALPDKAVDKRGFGRGIARYRVIMPGEQIVIRHDRSLYRRVRARWRRAAAGGSAGPSRSRSGAARPGTRPT